MPRYDYWCAECQATFEKQLKMAQADQVQQCPTCGEPARKVLALFAFHGGSMGAAADMPEPQNCGDEAGGCCGGGACGMGGMSLN